MRPGVGKGPWPGEGAARPSACAGSGEGREGAVRGRGAGGPVSGFRGGSALAGAPGRSWTCCRRWSAFCGGVRWGMLVKQVSFGYFFGAAAGTPTTSRTPLAGTARAGVRGFFPWAYTEEVVGFSPFAFILGSITPLSCAGRYISKMSASHRLRRFLDLFIGKRFVSQ